MGHDPDPATLCWEAAQAALAAPDEVPPLEPVRRRQLLVAIWLKRSFGPWEGWALFEAMRPTYEPNERLVRHLWWDQANEISAIRAGSVPASTAPTVQVVDRLVGPDACNGVLASPPKLELVVHNTIVGLDGETTGLRTHGTTIEWWGDGPPGWAPAVAWAGELWDALRLEPECAGP